MAIYTQYGRYLKAKMFKEALESSGTTYMLLGLGNPQWDATNAQEMPVAPYDLSSVTPDGQFKDQNISQWFQTNDSVIEAWPNSGPVAGNAGAYLKECENLQPIFPAIWQPSEDETIFSSPASSPSDPINNFKQSNYQTGYITEQDGAYTLYFMYKDSAHPEDPPISSDLPIDFNILTDLEKQYFADLYLRGRARDIIINDPLAAFENRLPVGLLGAVKCSINFVKDIGFDDSNYTGSIDEFWYGDRYWKIVRPDDDAIIEDYVLAEDNQTIFPHHLLINATLNPRTLCDNLIIDQVIVPRHIAIFTKKNEDDSTPPRYYRAYENVFNFGQYNEEEYESIDSVTNNGVTGTKLGFTLKTQQQDTEYSTPKGEFTFWLHDYIHGQIRETHSIDRIGYVIGF